MGLKYKEFIESIGTLKISIGLTKRLLSQVNFNDDVVLLSEELEFIEKLVDITTISTKRAAEKLVKNSVNTRITDFV
jgi:hypothetical protein